MGKITKNLKWIILSIVVVIFFILSVCVVKENLGTFDTTIYNTIKSLPMDKYFRYVTEFGDVFVFLVLILLVFSVTKTKKYTVLLTLNLAGVALINFALKNIFTRE